MKFLLMFCLLLASALVSTPALAVDPVCDTSWSKTATVWTCTGNGRVTFPASTSFVPASNLTISANNGFVLSNNIVGSNNIRVNLQSSYGDYSVSGSTVYGNLTSSSGVFTVSNSTLNGTVTSGGNLNFSASTVTGLVTSQNNTITATNSNFGAGLTSRSGITLTGGSVNGAITMTALNTVRLTGVTMPTGSISGASQVYLDDSNLGSASANVNVTTGSNDIYVQGGSVIYGNLSAAVNSNGTVQVQNGQVYGTCLPKSNPVNACNATPPASVHHYELSYSGPGLTCEAEAVSIKACTNQACSTLYNGSVSLTLTASNGASWSNASPALSAGSAVSYVRKTSLGPTVLAISGASPAASNALVCRNGGAIDSSCSLSFADTALKFYNVDNQIAGEDRDISLRAVQTNSDTGACQARVSGTGPVRLAYRCQDPTTCITGQPLNINGSNGVGGSNISGTAAATPLPNYQEVSLTFDNSGSAPLRVHYPDVGRIALQAELVLAASGNEPLITLTAPPVAWVVKPHSISVGMVSNASGTVLNPAGTQEANKGFLPAGTPFRVQLDVRNAKGALTPNFGNESPQAQLRLQFDSLVYPAGGNVGSLLTADGSFTKASAGQFQHNAVRWSEAGAIRLKGDLQNADYLGADTADVQRPASAVIGRFYPQQFVLTESSLGHTCPGSSPANLSFSYLGQPGVPLSFTLEARNLQGERLSNYDSVSYTEPYAGTAEVALVAENDTSPHKPSLGSRFSGAPTVQWSAGQYRFISPAQGTLQLQRVASVDGPFLQLQPGVLLQNERDQRNFAATALNMNAATAGDCTLDNSCNAIKISGTQRYYYGRYRLESVYGNAAQPLPAILKAEAWNGSQFVQHDADNCSVVQPALLTATGTPAISVSGRDETIRAGVSQTGALVLSAPGQDGRWDLRYQAPLWLKYNWLPAQPGDEDPTANAWFGRYRGNDRLIYLREQ